VSAYRPIHTYKGQATLKPNLLNRQEHAIIYTGEHVPEEQRYVTDDGTEVFENLSKDLIRVTSEQNGSEGVLNPASRINYNTIYIVEDDVRILNSGVVHADSIGTLRRSSLLYQAELTPNDLKKKRNESGKKKAQ
jgi:hypothetical protein